MAICLKPYNLTLTSVVFELTFSKTCVIYYLYLTLTSVVFELGYRIKESSQKLHLTLTSVVFEFRKVTLNFTPHLI